MGFLSRSALWSQGSIQIRGYDILPLPSSAASGGEPWTGLGSCPKSCPSGQPSWSSWGGQRILSPVSSISRLQDFQAWPCSWRSDSAAWPLLSLSANWEGELAHSQGAILSRFCKQGNTLLFLQPLSHNLKRIYCGDVSPWQITLFVSIRYSPLKPLAPRSVSGGSERDACCSSPDGSIVEALTLSRGKLTLTT